ncbi:Calcineurin-like phosphoesterase [Actinopolyspora xinjiangensis]|uniref:Calcineurin-like phosphoesterase n=1 Tax=Actinopolyspora xinjiangensis TaxID=405564 RepID=A0A1H0V855_9ACTN|nr:metallophosphoesterase family protein [Actinopolyspora xinjiangensis]SDP74415.1 Calcineurin-like phosphoesterase [Actinopolyspora xinjiangensis]
MSEEAGSVGRRALLRATGVGTAAAVASPAVAGARTRSGFEAPEPKLRFRPDGTFRIVQFNDTQDDERTDRRTIELMERTLDSENPDFALINGDVITGGCDSELRVKQAINNVVTPMESRGIPWAITFGNHDEDSERLSGMSEEDMLDFYMTYRHNRNERGPRDVTGTGDMVLPVSGSRGGRPVFALWLLDSGRYAPGTIAGQDFQGYPHWGWVRPDQIQWYSETSRHLERRAGGKVPGLMWMHIPLWEHRFMWFSSVDGRSEADHERAVDKHGIVGERNEDECPGPFNSGMFTAILQRGDVRGVFCGHDHVNSYVGDYYGVLLGYSSGTGFGPYGLGGAEEHRLRGARVFELDESVEGMIGDTRMVFARDFGIDMTPNDQPIDPLPLGPDQR